MCKNFGALRVRDDVNTTLKEGDVHALIGPNGAGKSTLIAQLCGELLPDLGQIVFDGDDITKMPAYKRPRLGLARSSQITELCLGYTTLENVVLSLTLLTGRAFNVWLNPRHEKQLIDEANHWLESVGLLHRANVRVSNLAHGEKCQLELAVALARPPKLLLLNEPMAGMGAEETQRMTKLLAGLKRKYTLFLVEHDMDGVFALADRMTVLVYGRTIFTGLPEDARNSPEVRAAYLGEGGL